MRLLLLLITFLVSSASSFATEVFDFEFFDNSNRKYTSLTFSDDLKRYYYGEEFRDTLLLVIQTPSLENEKYLKQKNALKKMGHEETPILYIVASVKQEDKSGYYTSTKVANNLVGGKPAFRLWLMNSEGIILSTAHEPLPAKQFKKWFKEGQDTNIPADVYYFIERRDGCDHFRGEPMYSEERKEDILKNMKELCEGSDEALSKMRHKHKDNKFVQKLLSVYDANIE
ncbi:MAG: hypothetical protein L3J51_07570 [Cocleimonas sp.]|nr:hypothetical protein [Cocleimonas sp.]